MPSATASLDEVARVVGAAMLHRVAHRTDERAIRRLAVQRNEAGDAAHQLTSSSKCRIFRS